MSSSAGIFCRSPSGTSRFLLEYCYVIGICLQILDVHESRYCCLQNPRNKNILVTGDNEDIKFGSFMSLKFSKFLFYFVFFRFCIFSYNIKLFYLNS